MQQVLLFSLTAAFNPTLLAATTVMLLLPSPKRLMLGYLLGAMLTSITLGVVIVFSLKNSSLVHTAKHTINPIVDLAVGAIFLVISLVLKTGEVNRLGPPETPGSGPRPPTRSSHPSCTTAPGSND
jgi:Sap-like sulfolipid-1-addressing protein